MSAEPMNKILVQTLIKGLEEAKNSMQNMQQQIHSMDITLTNLKSKSDNIGTDVSYLVKTIRDGNGKDPLLDRVNKLEAKAQSFDNHIENDKKTNIENVKGSWQLKIALVAGSLGMIGGIANTIMTLFMK